jgi:hypothetical protein
MSLSYAEEICERAVYEQPWTRLIPHHPALRIFIFEDSGREPFSFYLFLKFARVNLSAVNSPKNHAPPQLTRV